MKVFLALIDGKVEGWSYKKKVVKRFLKGYYKSHPESRLILAKASDKLHKTEFCNEIVSVCSIYLPRKYEDCYLYFGQDEVTDINEALELLNNILPLSKNAMKEKLLSAIALLETVKEDYDNYVPSMSELRVMRESVARWRECSGLFPL